MFKLGVEECKNITLENAAVVGILKLKYIQYARTRLIKVLILPRKWINKLINKQKKKKVLFILCLFLLQLI